MKLVFVSFFLIVYILQAITYSKLEPGMVLRGKDELISTLGLFKVTLNEANCSLSFLRFNKQRKEYQTTNTHYSGNLKGACSSLSILSNNKVVTQQKKIFWQLKSLQISYSYLMIDDQGQLRFIGLKTRNDEIGILDYEQIKWGNIDKSNNYITILDNYQRIADKFITTSNINNWFFLISNEQLAITNFANNQAATFKLPNLYFNINGIFNQYNQSYFNHPFIGIKYNTVCNLNKNKFYGPFVIEVDQYYPIFTIYDQEKYTIIQFTMYNNQNTPNPCPKHSFRLDNQCLNLCPPPYIHNIYGSQGQCLLSCQFGSEYVQKDRLCFCPNKIKALNPQYKCVNSSASLFGCYCLNNTYFDQRTRSCLTNCPRQLLALYGRCQNCPQTCSTCSFSPNQIIIISCTSCKPGYLLNRQGLCLQFSNCTNNCKLCRNNQCITCAPFYILYNNQCFDTCPSGTKRIIQNNIDICVSINSRQTLGIICRSGCLLCSHLYPSDCTICYPGYSLFITSRQSTCKQKNILYSCKSQIYSSLMNDSICYHTDPASTTTLSACRNQITNCNICFYNNSNLCLVCNNGFLLKQYRCVKRCGVNYTRVNQGCIKNINNCSLISFISNSFPYKLTLQTINTNKQYFHHIHNSRSHINQPYGYQLYLQSNLYFNSDIKEVDSQFQVIKTTCARCLQGFGLSMDGICLPCPPGCLFCTINENIICLSRTKSQLNEYLNKEQSFCEGFLSQLNDCLQSCPINTLPMLSSELSKLICSPKSEQTDKYLKIDGSTFKLDNNRYIHKFIFSSNLKLRQGRLLQQQLVIDQSGNSVTFNSSKETEILNLANYLQRIQSVDSTYPVNIIYGINAQTSFKTFIKKWLAGIGYVLSIIIIIVHWIYIANNVLYKMDNLIIFAQSIYFFLFRNILISNPIAQFYYGWSWLHINFYPNYFETQLDFASNSQIPYALYNLDANMVRNAGSTLSFVLTFFIIWGIFSLLVYILDTHFGRKQLWYFNMMKNSLIATVQFVSYNLLYWCVAYLNYDFKLTANGSNAGLTVIVLGIILIYCGFRCYTNRIAGMYMVKRVAYASIIACSYNHTGYVGIIIFFQLIFGVSRMIIQKPKDKALVLILWLEEGFIIIFLIILYTSLNASVASILTTIFIYLWLLTSVADLADLYFLSKNKKMQFKCFKQLFQEKSASQSEQQYQIKEQFDDKAIKTDRPLNSLVIKVHQAK